jgi:hypothetical protein
MEKIVAQEGRHPAAAARLPSAARQQSPARSSTLATSASRWDKSHPADVSVARPVLVTCAETELAQLIASRATMTTHLSRGSSIPVANSAT